MTECQLASRPANRPPAPPDSPTTDRAAPAPRQRKAGESTGDTPRRVRRPAPAPAAQSPDGQHPNLDWPSDEHHQSNRERYYRLHLSHQHDAERLAWLSAKLSVVAPELAELARRWATEHLTISRDLHRKAR